MVGTINDIAIDYKTNRPKITLLLDERDCLNSLEELKEDKLSIEIKKWRRKRSLDANSYCWVLCDKIAKKLGNTTKEDIYKEAISYVGTFEPMIIEERAFDNFKRIWEMQGLGYLVKEVSRKDKCVKIQAYYGSSSYNSKEMAHLIDFIVEAAKQQNIETMPPKELESLKSSWR